MRIHALVIESTTLFYSGNVYDSDRDLKPLRSYDFDVGDHDDLRIVVKELRAALDKGADIAIADLSDENAASAASLVEALGRNPRSL